MKKHIFQIAFIALFLSFITTVSAQKNYLPGTVYMHSGEKIEGLINYKEWGRNPKKIDFKKTKTSEVTRYSPLEIQKFKVADETYTSATVDIEISTITLGRSIKFGNPEFKLEKVTAFLRTVVEGEKGLFLYIDKNQKSNFYIFHNDKYLLLLYKTYIVRPKESIYERSYAEKHNSKFKGQIKVYLSSCKSINSKIDSLEYELESLQYIFKKYYRSCANSDQFSIKEEKVRFSFGIITGLSLTKISFTTSATDWANFIYLSNSDFPISLNPVIGGYFEIHFPRIQGRITMNNEIIYTSYLTEQSYLDYIDENRFTDSFFRIGNSFIKLNSMMRYHYYLKKYSLFFDGGITFGVRIQEENYMIQESKFYTNERIKEGLALASHDFDTGFTLGFGVEIKSFQLEARYEYSGTGVSTTRDLGSQSPRFYFLVSYKI